MFRVDSNIEWEERGLRYDTYFGGAKQFGHDKKIHNSVIGLNWVVFDSKIIMYGWIAHQMDIGTSLGRRHN